MSDPKWVDDVLDALDGVDAGWYDAQEAADAQHEAEHGPERANGWRPEWVKLRDRITYSRDEKSGASSAESQEAQY